MIVSDTRMNLPKEMVDPKFKKFKLYYTITNLLSIVVYGIFSKTLISLNDYLQVKSELIAIIITTGVLNFLTLFLLVQILLSQKYNSLNFKIIEYFKNIPLAIISYFYLTRIYYLKLNEFYFYILTLVSIYFSLQSILNIILIESLNFKFENLIFKFLFRYFLFVTKSISLVLFLSTYSDDLTSSKFKVYIGFVVYFVCMFSLAFIFLYSKTKLPFFQIIFDTYIFIFDFNDKVFDRQSESINIKLSKKLNLNLNLTSIQVLIYFTIKFILILTSSYFWLFKSFDIYYENQDKTTLLSLLLEKKNRLEFINLIELEEKIRIRQFEFVVVLGSFLISILAYYIYYSYYYVNEPRKETIKKINRRSLTEQARLPVEISQLGINSITVDSFHDTSSFSSISNSSYTIERNSNFLNDSDESSLQVKNMNKQKSLSLHFSSIPYEEKFVYGYETSSGVISSATSLSSVYKEMSYFHKFSEPFSLWTTSCDQTINKSTITVNNLSLHNRQWDHLNESIGNSKVIEWFRKSADQANNLDILKLSPKFHSTNLDFFI